MSAYVALRRNPYSAAGAWFIGNEIDGLLRAKMVKKENGRWTLRPLVHIAIPFSALAPFIVERGFSIPQVVADAAPGARPLPSEQYQLDDAEAFQREFLDVIEEEEKRRERAADPSYTETWKETKDENDNL